MNARTLLALVISAALVVLQVLDVELEIGLGTAICATSRISAAATS